MNIIIGSTEGSVKKGMKLNLADLIHNIKTNHGGSVDAWWDNEFIALQMDMELIEEGRKIHSYFFKRLGRYWD